MNIIKGIIAIMLLIPLYLWAMFPGRKS